MKILDLKRKGNVVRFFLGPSDLEEWEGNAWDIAPYEHNAGSVDSRFVSGIHDVAFSFDDCLIEAGDSGMYSGYSKQDLRKRIAPILIVVVGVEKTGGISQSFRTLAVSQAPEIRHIYLGDPEAILDSF